MRIESLSLAVNSSVRLCLRDWNAAIASQAMPDEDMGVNRRWTEDTRDAKIE